MDRDNLEVAALIQGWLAERGLYRQSAKKRAPRSPFPAALGALPHSR
jgi:hypothetical protein